MKCATSLGPAQLSGCEYRVREEALISDFCADNGLAIHSEGRPWDQSCCD
jgi:hypothetical protein